MRTACSQRCWDASSMNIYFTVDPLDRTLSIVRTIQKSLNLNIDIAWQACFPLPRMQVGPPRSE